MKKSSLCDEIHLKNTFFHDVMGEQVVELELATLLPFENHPFKVLEDETMTELVESIDKFGVASPIIVREKGRGMYEIIAGHRRTKACELLGKSTIFAIIRDLDDEEATLYMVDTNIQREEILPSEKAFAYKMKLEAIKRKAGRPEKNCTQLAHNSETKKSVEIIAEDSGTSKDQVRRYIRLTCLTTDFLDLVDSRKIPFSVGVETSYLSHEEQLNLLEIMDKLKVIPSLDQSTRLKTCSKEGSLTLTVMESILTPCDTKPQRVSLKVDSGKYFPKGTPKAKMVETIELLLENWKQSHETTVDSVNNES